jgi:hypothetical protein
MQYARRAIILLSVFCALTSAQENMTPVITGPGYVWWEGEDAVSHNFGPPSAQLLEATEGMLSGSTWLTVQQSPAPAGGLTATWRIQVPRTARYDVWARVGWRGWSGNDWRLDGGPWQTSGADDAYFNVVHHIRFRPASWVLFGSAELDAGEHEFHVRFREGQPAYQAFDCFVLSEGPFTPLGKFRPDEEIRGRGSRGAAEGWWPFQPQYRPGEEKVLDLSFMNDPIGEHGFVTMRDGELYFEDGTPVRFWGLNISYWGGRMIFPPHRAADLLADHLAQYGVNCVRLHVLHSTNSIIDAGRDDTQHFDAEKLDRLDYLAYALRSRGIYVNLDFMYHRMFKEGDDIDPELVGTGTRDGYNVNWAAGSAALFHPRAIELNRKLYRDFITHVNPYTGMRWADDPHIAIVTIQNEQSIFWGTTNVHIGRPRELLDELHTEWLREQYGTQEALAAAWQVPGQGSPFRAGEDLNAGLIQLGSVVSGGGGAEANRGRDQLRFLYDLESGFYRDTIAAMREWGVRCPIITSNWRGAGQSTRLVIQASATGDLVDRHDYHGGNRPMLAQIGRGIPGSAFDQVAGRAFGISEWNAQVGGERVAEAVPLVAVVSAFQGWDAMYHFSQNSPTWQTFLRGLNITPGHYALYPAAAMIFRRGDIRPGELVFERRRDPARQFGFQNEERGAPPEVLAVGRVQNAYVEEPTPDLLESDVIDYCWDRAGRVVHGCTGEFDWHYGDEWMRLNAARTQGAFGALAGRRIVCDDVAIETPNAHCAVIVSSLDGRPIPESSRLLVSAVGRSQNTAMPPERGELPEGSDDSMPPCLMEPVTGTVAVRTELGVVTAVDVSGYAAGPVEAGKAEDGFLTFDLTSRPGVLFYVIGP